MSENKAIEQPGIDLKELLDDIMSAEDAEFVFRGKKRRIGWLYNETIRKFTHMSLKEKNERKKNVKLCVILLLNSRWGIFFKYWFLWRKLYYFSDINDVEVLRVLDACKKKIPSTASSLVTILSTGMTDVMMAMTRDEVKASQAEQAGVQPTH